MSSGVTAIGGLGVSNGALLVGGLTLIGLTTLALIGGKRNMKMAMATQAISQEGVEDMLFAAVLDSADIPATVMRNEDRVREAIKAMKPTLSDLIKQYTDGRMDYQELKQEIVAMSALIHEQLDIPVRAGADKKFHPNYENFPRKYGHRNKSTKMINHGGAPRENGTDCDCIPSNLERTKPGKGAGFEQLANAYPGKALGRGFGNVKDDGYHPASFAGYELGRGNPHDDNTIPIVPIARMRPRTHPHPTHAGRNKDPTHGQNSISGFGGRRFAGSVVLDPMEY